MQRINKSRSWFFEKINKTDKPLTRFIKEKAERTQIKSEMKEDKLQLIPHKLYAEKFENLSELDTFLETYNLPKLCEAAESLNRPITASETEVVIKKNSST